MMRLRLLLPLVGLLVAGRAAAEPAHRVDLRWQTSDGCIDEATLAATVEQTLGRPVFHFDGRPAGTVEGLVAPVDRGFHASITLRSPKGNVLASRELATGASSCSRLDESVAIVIVLMVDGLPEPKLEPAPVEPTPLRVPMKPPRALPVPAFRAEAGFAYVGGLLPATTTGLYGRVGAGFGESASMAVGISGWLPSQVVAEPGVGASMSAFAVELDACLSPWRWSTLRFGACLLGGGGAVFGRPFGLVNAGNTVVAFPLIGLAVTARVSLSKNVWAELHAGAWAIYPPHFVYHASEGAPPTSLYVGSVVVPAITFGLGVRGGS
jgi:hypothetical protein